MVFAHDAVLDHELQADLAVDQLLADAHQGGILHDVGGRIHQLLAFQPLELVQAGLAHQHLDAGGAAFGFQHVQARGFHADAHLAAADQGDAALLADALQLGFGFFHAFLLLAHLVAHRVDGVLDLAALGEQPAVPVDVGDFVGDFRGQLLVFGGDADVHQRRVAVLLHAQAARQDLQGQFRGHGRLVLVELRAPDLLEVQVPDDRRQHRPGPHDFFLRHQEEGIVAHAVDLALVEGIHVHGVFADLELGGRGELLRHHQRVGGARHDGEQRDRQDDLLAVADDAPIVEEVEGRGLGFFCHGGYVLQMPGGAMPPRVAGLSGTGKRRPSPVASPVLPD